MQARHQGGERAVKRYSVERTDLTTVAVCETLEAARAVSKTVGEDHHVITWVGHVGFPAVAAVMWSNGEVDQVETICLYRAEAERIARVRGPGFFVRDIVLNCRYPQGGDEGY